MSAYSTAPGWTVGWIGKRLLAACRDSSIEIELERTVSASILGRIFGDIEVVSQPLDGEEIDEIRKVLVDGGVLVSNSEKDSDPATGLSRGTATQSLRSHLVGGINVAAVPTVILGADEALILPAEVAGDGPKIRRVLRLFVSGVASRDRLRLYGAQLAGTGQIYSETPLPALKQAAGTFASVCLAPTVVSCTATGELSCPLDGAVRNVAVGRLHPVQDVSLKVEHGHPVSVATALARYAPPNLRYVSSDASKYGGALATDPEEAQFRAVAEATERFAAGDVSEQQIVYSKAGDLDAPFLNPESVVSFLPDQHRDFPGISPFQMDEPRQWTLGRTAEGEDVWVLADLVFYPMSTPPGRSSARHFFANSSGVAAGPNPSTAALWAYQELVERDAFMRAWLGRQSCPRIRASSLDPSTSRLLEWVRLRGWSVELMDISGAHGAAVVMAAAFDGRRVALGAAAGGRAPYRSMLELVACVGGAERRPPDVPAGPEAVRSPRDHRLLYSFGKYADAVEFLWSGKAEVSADELPTEPAPIPETVATVDLSSDLTRPLSVVRCVSTGLIPITFGYGREPLGLSSVADVLSRDFPLAPDCGYLPHPFP